MSLFENFTEDLLEQAAIDILQEMDYTYAFDPDISFDGDKGKIKVVMTGSVADNERLQKHIGGKQRRDTLARRMKDNNDELKIVIVRYMWLTGFDVP